MPDPMIRISGLNKVFGPAADEIMPMVRHGMSKQELLETYGCVLGLRNIDLSVPRQCVQVVMGLSGSGKSTLIRHINRLIEPTTGTIVVDGADVSSMDRTALRDFRRHKASMVFQRFALMPHRTVRDNVGYGLKIQGKRGDDLDAQVSDWIERIGLDDFADRYPAELSGGMQQRVGLGRALATDPDVLLMDEAFSALDPLIRVDMQNMLLELQKELKKTIVFITHDLDEALRIGDNIAILRDGSIVQQGDPQDIVLSPADDYVADFVKDVNRGRVIRVENVMEAQAGRETGPKIPASTPLEQAVLTLSEAAAETGTVTNGNGRAVGIVSRDALIAAMVRPTDPVQDWRSTTASASTAAS